MRPWTSAAAAILMSFAGLSLAHAASLQVSPTGVEMKAPSAASQLRLRNPGSKPLKAQVRVFRWSQTDKGEVLEPTTDFVASPPMASVAPGGESVIRLVRLSKQPVGAEENYRIVVDELPDLTGSKSGVLNIAFRYSIPVFVTPPTQGKPELSWSFRKQGDKTVITAVNNGTRRVRLAALQVKDPKGRPATIAPGLAGYVLAHSSMSWVAPGTVQATGGTPLLISAQGDQGAINAEARAEAAR